MLLVLTPAKAEMVPIVALPFNQFLIQKGIGSSLLFVDTTGNYGDISLNKLPEGMIKQGQTVGKSVY